MAQDSRGLRYLNQLKMGVTELDWLQAEVAERVAWMLVGLAHECGWVADYVGPFPNYGWTLEDVDGEGRLRVVTEKEGVGDPFPISRVRGGFTPFFGVDRKGRPLEIRADARIRDENGEVVQVPDDDTWYTLIAKYHLEQYEPGALTLTGGSTTVTGTRTQFTRYHDGSDPRATFIRIAADNPDAGDTANGNEGAYEIATITDDETMTLVEQPPNSEDGVRFRVKGQFFGAEPADPDCHNVANVAWELVPRTCVRPADGALIAYDVKHNAGTTSFIDRRASNVYRPVTGEAKSFYLSRPRKFNIEASTETSLELGGEAAFTSNTAGHRIVAASACPCRAGSHLSGLAEDQPTGVLLAVLFDDTATRHVRIRHWTAAQHPTEGEMGQWGNPDGGGTVTVITAVGLLDVSVVALPQGAPYTHLCFYIVSTGELTMKTSADNGATWVGPTTIWNPASAATLAKCSAVVTRLGRVIVVCDHSGNPNLRYVYSDDHGDTWQTNTDSGFTMGGSTTVRDMDVVEDDRGNLWTVAAAGTSNGVRLFRGQAEGNPAPSSDEQSTANGWKVGPDGTPAASSALVPDCVSAFALPNGMIGAFIDSTNEANDSETDVYFLAIARQYLMSYQMLLQNVSADADDPTVPLCCTVTPGGLVVLFYTTVESSGAVLRPVPFVPIAIDRASSLIRI